MNSRERVEKWINEKSGITEFSTVTVDHVYAAGLAMLEQGQPAPEAKSITWFKWNDSVLGSQANDLLDTIARLQAKNRELAYQLFNQNGAIDAAVYGGKLSDTGFIRAFWRRIFVYRNDFEKELLKELPVEFAAAFETAAILLRKPSDCEPEIGGPK